MATYDEAEELVVAEETDIIISSNNYEELTNKPTINGVEVIGNMTGSALGLQNSESGKGLSANDYTNAEKTKLTGIAAGAQVNVIESISVNNTALTPTEKAVNITIPEDTGDLTNNAGFITNAVANLVNYYNKTTIDGMVSSAIKYKGTVATYSALPNNASNGDLYYVTADSKSYVWNSTESDWDEMSGTIDLSPYLTKTEAGSTYLTITNAQTTYQAKENGKGLSTNDYTTAEKNKLGAISTGSVASGDTGYVTGGAVYTYVNTQIGDIATALTTLNTGNGV